MSQNKGNDHEVHKTPEWLKTIQLNSWEAELLISALLLFALIQLPDYLEEFTKKNIPPGNILRIVLNTFKNAIRLLTFGYVAHIITRGLWVASVGLSYVFPKGIDKDRLKFKGKFDQELDDRGVLEGFVIRLEKLCSMIYGISFLLFGTFLGLGMTFFIVSFLSENVIIYGVRNKLPLIAILGSVIQLTYIAVILIVLVDYVTNGLLRRSKSTAGWYYYIAVFFRWVSLSFLYRRSLLVLISNIRSWKSFLVPSSIIIVVALYIFLDIRLGKVQSDRYYSQQNGMINKANYENLRDDDDRLIVTIPADVIDEKVIKVFVRDLSIFNRLYDNDSERISGTKWDLLDPEIRSGFLLKWLNVTLNENDVSTIQWYLYQHPESFDFGFVTYLNVENEEVGNHLLSVTYNEENLVPKQAQSIEENRKKLAVIPFVLSR